VSTDAETADSATPDQPAATYAWELAGPHDPDLAPLGHRLLRALSHRVQWRTALLAVQDRAAQLAAADYPAGTDTATEDTKK